MLFLYLSKHMHDSQIKIFGKGSGLRKYNQLKWSNIRFWFGVFSDTYYLQGSDKEKKLPVILTFQQMVDSNKLCLMPS